MIWHLILKPIWNLLFGNRRARQLDAEMFDAEMERHRELKAWMAANVHGEVTDDGW